MTETEANRYVALIVDDSLQTIAMMNDVLDNAGFDVLIALEGQQALTITKNITPDIILMDAVMPVMNGFETCSKLKDEPKLKQVPIIFMTGLDDTESIVKGFDAGGIDYITKPINIDELIIRMRSHIHNAQLTMSARNALDTAGQYLFSCNANGEIQWATPQANQAFSTLSITLSSIEEALTKQISTLINAEVKSNKGVKIKVENNEYEIRYIGLAGDNEYLLRIMNVSSVSEPQMLKKAFAITQRESEVLFWISKGKTNREIGIILTMSPRTVNKHLEQIFKKLGVENRTSAAAMSLGELSKAL